MTPEEQAESLALMNQMNAYFDALIVAGVSEQMVLTTAVVTCSQRALRHSTPTKVAAWLHGQARHIETHGVTLKRALG